MKYKEKKTWNIHNHYFIYFWQGFLL
jgi:hypothetical protein